ncbi:MAG: RrF2 family transcriptional regulator [Roseiflexaceae bacterium]
MMRMSSQVEYGLRAMIDIAVHGVDVPVQAGEIHRRQNIDEHFISQILLMLRRAGLIESLRGRQGGHRLSRPASRITVLEIIEALEGCDLTRERPINSSIADALVVRNVWTEAREQAQIHMQRTTLADLCEQRNQLVASSYNI